MTLKNDPLEMRAESDEKIKQPVHGGVSMGEDLERGGTR
jgi:hypothetical protein